MAVEAYERIKNEFNVVTKSGRFINAVKNQFLTAILAGIQAGGSGIHVNAKNFVKLSRQLCQRQIQGLLSILQLDWGSMTHWPHLIVMQMTVLSAAL